MTATLAVAAIPLTVKASEYKSSGATSFVFSDDKITVNDGDYTDYTIEGTNLTIDGKGTYIVSGACSDGSIKVKKGTEDVTLVLNGITLTSEDTAPITCNKSSDVTIVAAEGTENSLSDSANNNDDNYPDNENAENAVIKCKDGSQVTVCGSGTVNINANGKNGIKSGASTDEEGEASMTIKDITLNITADVNDGINAEASLNILSGTITVDAADDGIHCDYEMNIGETNNEGPTINITDCYEGLEASNLNVYSGDIKINSEDDCINAANADLAGYEFTLNIFGGTLNMNTTAGDGIDSNGSLNITGGTVEVWTANKADNQPLDADGTISITGGTVFAAGGSNGMGMNLDASQPYVIYGSSTGDFGRQPGGMDKPQGQPDMNFDGQNRPDEKPDMNFDGQNRLDEKPDEITDMPSDNKSLPEKINGSDNMPAMPDMQNSGGSSLGISEGDKIYVKDSSGKTIYSTEAFCNVGYVFFSSAKLSSDSTYMLYSGDTELADTTALTESVSEGMGQMPNDMPSDRQNSQPENVKPSNTKESGDFTDVSNDDWYYDAVRYSYEKGLMQGVSSDKFNPDGTVTRGMIVSVLYRLEGSPAVDNKTLFSDVSSDKYYSSAVTWASDNGIISGYSDGNFGPDDTITREQLASVLYRYAKYKGYDTSSLANISSYSDSQKVSVYAETAVAWANKAGIISGTDKNLLNPSGSATRAQAASILMRFCENISKQ